MNRDAELDVAADMVDMAVRVEQQDGLVCQLPDRGCDIAETHSAVDYGSLFRTDDQFRVAVLPVHQDPVHAVRYFEI